MRILMVGTRRPLNSKYGGIERHIRELSNELRTRGHDVDVLESDYPNAMAHEWGPFDRLATRAYELRRNYDLVHFHGERTAFFWFLWEENYPAVIWRLIQRKGRVPTVLTCHSPSWRNGASKKWTFWPERDGTRWPRGLVALSDPMMVAFPPATRRQTRAVIPTGVDTDRFRPGVPGDSKVALGVGAVVPRKNWSRASQALQGTGIEFRLAGPYGDAVEAQHHAGPNALLLGEVTDERLIEEYQRCGFLIHPSGAETGSVGAVLQAQACGKPVLVSPAAKESMIPDATGFVCETPEEFRAAAITLSTDEVLRQRMGARARAYIEKQYAWPVIAAQHEKLYEAVLDR